jgi:ATP-binding cassette, subfamily C, bacterial CydC
MTTGWALSQLRYRKLETIAAIALGTLTILASVGLMSASGYLISWAALKPAILDLMLVIVAVRFFGIARAGVRYAERLVSHDLTFRLLNRLRCWVYQRLEPIIPGNLGQHHSGDLLTRLVSDVETLQNLYVRVASPVIVAVLVAAISTGLLWQVYPAAAVCLLIGLTACGALLPLAASRLARRTSSLQVSERATLQRHIVDSIGGMDEVLALGIEEIRLKEYGEITGKLTRLQGRQARLAALHVFLVSLLTWGTVLPVLLIIVSKIQSGGISGLFLAAVTFGVLASFEAVQPLPGAYQFLEQCGEASRRIYEVIEERPLVKNPIDPLPIPAAPCYAFRNVSFAYPGACKLVLRDVSFDLPFGQRIAIVGRSGVGKSTVVNLLCRFFDPQQGTILLGEEALTKYSIKDARSLLGVLEQRPHIFNTSIRENLLLARAEATDSDLMDVLDDVGLAGFVRGLPAGFDTLLGSEGFRLSGGQRQRLALARVLLKDAPVLLLDEATANLDWETERDVMDRIIQLTRNRSLVMLTHRTRTLSGLETVFRLQEGSLQLLSSRSW